jgi:hypothetical protein
MVTFTGCPRNCLTPAFTIYFIIPAFYVSNVSVQPGGWHRDGCITSDCCVDSVSDCCVDDSVSDCCVDDSVSDCCVDDSVSDCCVTNQLTSAGDGTLNSTTVAFFHTAFQILYFSHVPAFHHFVT